MKTPNEITPSDLAVNLDGFLDSADIHAHVADLLARLPSDSQTYVSPIPKPYLDYAKRKARAMDCRQMGLIDEAMRHESACDSLWCDIPRVWRW